MLVDMNALLRDAARVTARFLDDALPSMSGVEWWDLRVLQVLSEKQRNIVERHGYTSLSQLDLAALLHTLDNNWHALDSILQFPPGARNFVKEMRAMRNRWNHEQAEHDYVVDDIYRDLDTLERFLEVVHAEQDVLGKVRRERLAVAVENLKEHSPNVLEQAGPPPAATERVSTSEEPDVQSCPACGSAMVLRTARNGRYAGSQFWGCSEWSVTGCNGIINIAKPQDANSEPPPTCPSCESSMVRRTARNGPHAGSQFWGCSEWGITGCGGLRHIPEDRIFASASAGADDLQL